MENNTERTTEDSEVIPCKPYNAVAAWLSDITPEDREISMFSSLRSLGTSGVLIVKAA